ncbi:DUF692 domain-containing protein [Bradyrhizobium sp.]|uniref:DUF692 domain-containing protein n=1 Tax=Bradyrhizobium sp. TaxID=376 RepID=UPI003C1C341D
MKPAPREKPSVGLAYSSTVLRFAEANREEVDYLEVPFELLRHAPDTIEHIDFPILLHCASLSLAGSVACSEQTLSQIAYWIAKTRTPWLGEHLAYITSKRTEAGPIPEEYAPGEPYNIGYTVGPVMNEAAVERIAKSIERYGGRLQTPLLIENSPIYFESPGSTLSQSKFIAAISERIDVGLLLDLSHFYLSSRLIGYDPLVELEELPLSKVVEVHLSGIDERADGSWDDHSCAAPKLVHEMLAHLLKIARPRAVTLEYNWSSRFPHSLLKDELQRVRALLQETNA